MDWPILSMTIWTPILGGLLVLGSGDKAPNVSRWLALIVALLTFVISLQLYSGFAFGMGVERPAMLIHGITDIRQLLYRLRLSAEFCRCQKFCGFTKRITPFVGERC